MAAEQVNQEGRQYHIGLAPGEVAPFILLCGEPQRAKRVAQHFDEVTVARGHREYYTITGSYQGLPVSVMGTGIGCDNTEIAVVELCQLVERPTFLRVGSTGALQAHSNLGDLVISTGAVRLENTSLGFVEPGYPAVAHREVVLALLQAAAELQAPHHLGLTATASGFYGFQGRNMPGFPPRDPELWQRLAQAGVLNLEMESSTLFTLASLRGVRAGTVCAVYAQRPRDQFIAAADIPAAEARAIAVGLRALQVLHAMDQARGQAPHWYPSLGLKL